MKRIAAVTACPTGIAHTMMAAEALKKAASVMGHQIKVETQGSAGAQDVLSEGDIASADVVLLAADIRVDPSRFAGKPIYETRTSEAIRNTRQVIEGAIALAGAQPASDQAPQPLATGTAEAPPEVVQQAPAVATPKRLVGITSCPTGIAHTFMAAEALQKAAKSLGHQIKVETQGSVGSQNTLTAEDIAAADAVVIAADTKVDTSRFAGKPIYMTGTKQAMHSGQQVIQDALAQPVSAPGAGVQRESLAASVERGKAERAAARTGPYKHLMTGVSYMLPFVVAGGLLIALAFALGGIYVYEDQYTDTLGWSLFQIGARNAFTLMVPILAGFIAFSIADRPGLAPGMIGGMLASSIGAGFIGGMIAGFVAGYATNWLNKTIKLPPNLAGLKPILILPLLGSLIVGLLMVYVIGKPAAAALTALTGWLTSMQSGSALVLGLILGAMMAFDMGGPVNKAAYTFAVGLIASEVYRPMAAVMAAGMTPPLGLALATWLFKNRWTEEEREAGAAAGVLGIAFITEGAIPFAARDPFRVIPSIMLGSAITGALTMVFGATLRVPHGGVFVLPIPNAVGNLALYVVAILVGTVVTAVTLGLLMRPLAAAATEPVIAEPAGQPVRV